MKIRRGFVATELTAVGFILFSIVIGFLGLLGWIFNIIALAGMNFDKFTGEHVVRIIGVFLAPVGALAGWFL